VIGIRRSRPNAFELMRMPGGFWRRLYSARSTRRMTRSTTSGEAARDDLLAAEVLLDVEREDAVERVVVGQRVLVASGRGAARRSAAG
jgi:hypothetical protein